VQKDRPEVPGLLWECCPGSGAATLLASMQWCARLQNEPFAAWERARPRFGCERCCSEAFCAVCLATCL